MNRQKRFLMLLLALLALSGAYAYWSLPTQQRVASEAEPGARGADRKAVAAAGSGLKLEQLQQSVPEFAGVRRDIFNFKKAPPPPPPPPPKIEKPLPPPPPPTITPPPPMAVPSVAAARFDFLGLLSKGEKDLLFLASGKDIYLVAAGDRFGDQQRFLLKSVDESSIVIEQQGLDHPIVINLMEQDSSGTSVRPSALSRPLPGPAPVVAPTTRPPASQAPADTAPPTQRFRSFKRYRP